MMGEAVCPEHFWSQTRVRGSRRRFERKQKKVAQSQGRGRDYFSLRCGRRIGWQGASNGISGKGLPEMSVPLLLGEASPELKDFRKGKVRLTLSTLGESERVGNGC